MSESTKSPIDKDKYIALIKSGDVVCPVCGDDCVIEFEGVDHSFPEIEEHFTCLKCGIKIALTYGIVDVEFEH